MARLGIGRMHYTVSPGLYYIGNPGPSSPILVTANYKLTFDTLRKHLAGTDAWLLVVDTKGINVWCAAGEGIFSDDEVAERVKETGVLSVAKEGTLILPQLSAPGVSASEVEKRTGLPTVFGPVRARDLRRFIENGFTCSEDERKVTFTLKERLVLIPVEVKTAIPYLLVISAVIAALAGIQPWGYDPRFFLRDGATAVFLLLSGFACGAVATPILLPHLPGRALSFKGLTAGCAVSILWILHLTKSPSPFPRTVSWMGWALIIPAVSSFTAMNFTGSTSFTSLSGVIREMKRYIPIQIILATAGMIIWIGGKFL